MTEPKFENLLQALDEYGKEVADLYKKRLLLDDKKASGKLIDSVQSYVAYQGNEFVVFLELQGYYKYVENGSAPHFPPVDKILEWVKVKKLLPRPYTLKNGKTKLPTENQMAWMISKKIARDGIAAGNQLRETIEAVNSYYYPIIAEALNKDISGVCAEVFNVVTGKLRVIG